MKRARAWTIACNLAVIMVASQVSGEYDGQGSEMLESPRVERMHSETSDGCMGSNCLTQHAVGAMWFGPRLGRRRRSDGRYSVKGTEALGEVFGSPGLSFIAIPEDENKLQEMRLTPRLDRELGDTFFMRNLLHSLLNRIEDQTLEEQEEQTSTPIFLSRLGHNHMAPRLERQHHNVLWKFQPQMP